jgi:hypothetical protein
MVILLPGRIESISLLLVANINDEFELIVANELPLPPPEPEMDRIVFVVSQ